MMSKDVATYANEEKHDENLLGRAKKSNLTSRFFPSKTTFDVNKPIEWEAVVGLVVSSLSGNSIEKGYALENFKTDCKSLFSGLLEETDAWKVIEEVYFSNDQLSSISPEFLIFKHDQKSIGIDSKQVAIFFSNLFSGKSLEFKNENLNFVEDVFPKVLAEKMTSRRSDKACSPYLPFMAEFFWRDIEWLSRNPEYFQRHIQTFLSVYIFLYGAQLGLTIGGWESGEPLSAKPLYFIIENEKVSLERTHVIHNGFKSFRKGAEKIFAYLSMNELLQIHEEETLPLWAYFQQGKETLAPGGVEKLKALAIAFAEDRGLNIDPGAMDSLNTMVSVIDFLLKLSMEQFTNKKSSRLDVHLKYANYIEKKYGNIFVSSRGRVGRILVIPSDILVLFTNIVIGDRNRVRLHELLKDFNARGIFFDRQSEQALISFYNNMGNSIRLSDSGDAVYVCKTV